MQILYGGRVIDGRGNVMDDAVVTIEDGRIGAIVPCSEFTIPRDGCDVYDARNRTVMPGLMDCHTHIQESGRHVEAQTMREVLPKKAIRAASHARETLEGGYTTIRDLGSELFIDLGLRDALEEGLVPGPRMLVSSYKIMPTGADFQPFPPEVQVAGWETMDSPHAVRKAVRHLSAIGVDLIKIMTTGRTFRKQSSPDSVALTLEEARTAVEEAHNQGKKVSAHAHGSRGVKMALEAGCDSVEHGTVIDDDDVETMVRNGVFLVPTMSYSSHVKAMGDACTLPDYVVEKTLKARELRLKSLARAVAGGVRIAAGSDAGMPSVYHGDNAYELMAMVEAGMKPRDVIVAATSAAAELLGIDDIVGSVTTGKVADLLVVEGDPEEDVSLLRNRENIRAIFQSGRLVIDRGLQLFSE